MMMVQQGMYQSHYTGVHITKTSAMRDRITTGQNGVSKAHCKNGVYLPIGLSTTPKGVIASWQEARALVLNQLLQDWRYEAFHHIM
jgi:hypothetical protein